MTYIEKAIKAGHAKISGNGKQQKITYIAVDQPERYSGPEEQSVLILKRRGSLSLHEISFC